MAQAIRLRQTGGPEVLELETVEVGEPGPGQARVRHSYVAVNFIDIYFRTGFYPLPLPSGLGSDAVGVVEAIGPGVVDIAVGDRVGYLLGPQGAYSDVRIVPAGVLIPLPDGDFRPGRVGPHDEGHDRAIPVPAGLSARGRRDDPLSRRGRRRGSDCMPMGACSRRHDDRHRQHRREGRSSRAANGCAHVIVTSREDIAARGTRNHRRQGRSRCLRTRSAGIR